VRGGLVGVLFASALLAVLAAAHASGLDEHDLLRVAHVFFVRTDGYPPYPPILAIASVLAAFLVGAGLGMLGQRLRLRPRTRGVVLILVSIPALYVLIVIAEGIGLVAASLVGQWTVAPVLATLLLPFFLGVYGTAATLPVALLPVILAAFMIEGWTRHEANEPTGLARPVSRGRVVAIVLVVTAGLAGFAIVRWPGS